MKPSAWTRLRAAVDPFTRRTFGLYSAYTISPEEFIDSVYLPLGVYDLREYLTGQGYTAQRLSAAKRHPDSGRLHVLSMRRRPETHPAAARGTALDGYDARQLQFHLHAFSTDVSGFLDCFIHLELAPDLRPLAGETWPEALRRAAAHYSPTWDREDADPWDVTYVRGVADSELDL